MNIQWFFVSILSVAVSWLVGWNIGYDVGKETGKNEAIIEGKVVIECHFPCREGRSR